MEIPTHGENQGILSPPTTRFTTKILKSHYLQTQTSRIQNIPMKTRIMNEGMLGRKAPQFLLGTSLEVLGLKLPKYEWNYTNEDSLR
jgi:hypothetical protein